MKMYVTSVETMQQVCKQRVIALRGGCLLPLAAFFHVFVFFQASYGLRGPYFLPQVFFSQFLTLFGFVRYKTCKTSRRKPPPRNRAP